MLTLFTLFLLFNPVTVQIHVRACCRVAEVGSLLAVQIFVCRVFAISRQMRNVRNCKLANLVQCNSQFFFGRFWASKLYESF